MPGLTPRGSRLEQAQRLAACLAEPLSDEHREQLAAAPGDSIESLYGISVAFHEPRGSQMCSIDGIYRPDPPRISVAHSVPTRVAFSLLHELGHHLQRDSFEIMRAMQPLRPERRRALEEDVCDAFAAEILLPNRFVETVLTDREISAEALRVLAEARTASRAACCVRLAQRMTGDGYVVLARHDGSLLFCAAAEGAVRVARDAAQPAQSVLTRAAGAGRAQEIDRLTHRPGWQTPAMYADAVVDDDYVYAVYQARKPRWAVVPIPERERRPLAPQRICPHCDTEFEAYGPPCEQCDVPRCPHCERCGCQAQVTVRLCQGCWLQKPIAEFPVDQPLCDECHG